MAKILIVDDSEDLMEFLTYLLKANGHTVKAVFSSKDMRIHLSVFKPGILILDVQRDGGNGRDICRHLKTDPHCIPILLISASAGYLENYEECGADDVLVKPFDIVTLLQKVGTLLGGGKNKKGRIKILPVIEPL